MSKQLNPKQEAFIREYLISSNASDAYRRAGYKSKSPDVDGPALLGNPGIAAIIAEKQAEIKKVAEEKFAITQERILAELEALAFGNFGQLAEWDEETLTFIPKRELTERDIKYIDSIECVKTKTGNRHDSVETTTLRIKTMSSQKAIALKILGQHVGLFNKVKDGPGNNKRDTKAVLARVSALARKRGVG